MHAHTGFSAAVNPLNAITSDFPPVRRYVCVLGNHIRVHDGREQIVKAAADTLLGNHVTVIIERPRVCAVIINSG